MKKTMDKLLNNIRFDKKYLLFCLIIVIFGIITGSLFIVILNNSDKMLVVEYIETFIDNIKNNNVDNILILKNTAITNYVMLLIITIIGFTYFFFPINILILFYKSFMIGFILSSFILTYKIKGLILSFIYIFPHYIINIFLLTLLISFTIKLSISLIKKMLKKKEIVLGNYLTKYLCVILLIFILTTIASLYEAFVSSYLIKLISTVLL